MFKVEKKPTLSSAPPPKKKKTQQLWECLLFLAALIFIPYLIGILPCVQNVAFTARRSKHEVFYQHAVFLPSLCNFGAVKKKQILNQKLLSLSVCENLCTKEQL